MQYNLGTSSTPKGYCSNYVVISVCAVQITREPPERNIYIIGKNTENVSVLVCLSHLEDGEPERVTSFPDDGIAGRLSEMLADVVECAFVYLITPIIMTV